MQENSVQLRLGDLTLGKHRPFEKHYHRPPAAIPTHFYLL